MARCTEDKTYCQNIGQLSELLKVVAEPNRLKIICMIAKLEHCVCEIVEELSLAQNLISHHLAVLRDADIVTTRKEGTNVYYQLNATKVKLISSTLNGILDP